MEQQANKSSWLEQRLVALDAVYRRFGRDGLRDYSISDIAMLLVAKELQSRDTPKSAEQSERQMAENRQLELEIRDLRGYINALRTGAEFPGSRFLRQLESRPQQRQQFKPRQKGIDLER
jgi:hypothetical protein